MIIDLDPSCLRAFLAIAEDGGFTRAAARLNRTQPAISMQIRRLEDTLGARLFADRKRATLTPAGERLMGHAKRIVALNDEVIARTRGADVEGRVRIGTPDDYAAFMLPAVLRRLAVSHPNIEVEVRCGLSVELVNAVDKGQLDLALVTRLPGLQGGVTVRREPLLWVSASEELAARRPLPLAMFSPGCPFRDAALDALGRAQLVSRIAYESPSLASLLPAVSEGLAVAAIAASSVMPGMKVLGSAHGLPPLPVVEITVYGAHGVLSPAAQAVNISVMEALTPRERSAA
ncbi:MAG: LysR substrate-binding domain-containing protein [Hyphomicrobiales bacterium]|nr:LysR substrate-binding domain-containing protein [Hyphomicrobiales bacterium]